MRDMHPEKEAKTGTKTATSILPTAESASQSQVLAVQFDQLVAPLTEAVLHHPSAVVAH
jgi:hypothetical protein